MVFEGKKKNLCLPIFWQNYLKEYLEQNLAILHGSKKRTHQLYSGIWVD